MNAADVVSALCHAGNPTDPRLLLRYAEALDASQPIGPRTRLTEDQEDRALLALVRVDRPRATLEDLHQIPPLALSPYSQVLYDLAGEGLGPHDTKETK
ncbi:hypothetical protein SPF06_21435 [Sinomonas sp. JGH33]|uniref:Uncharacterized protein n=1 Tax=Sinomonas terricola TaxID=3110330 RepID=A0ABU5TC87_9MICC|nr:hypothetical protein [Sinomonas sp. JGH33]MEA5457288.1 hypothetical protein [Sinomonas sp. JGH33]